jgi:hypothetical protein
MSWVEVGTTYLKRGAYNATLLIPKEMALSRLEFAPPCLNPVEPLGGWRGAALTTPEDLAVTAIRALDREGDLAPASTAMELKGSDMLVVGGEKAAPSPTAAEGSVESTHLRAGRRGLHATLALELPMDGLYSVWVFGLEGAGQRWTAAGCRKAVICPPERETLPRWHHVLTSPFAGGRHILAVTLGAGATVQRIRVERKRDAGEEYIATLLRLGFDVGTTNPVPRALAVDAMNFIKTQRRQLLGEEKDCWDIEMPDADAVVTGAPAPTVPPVPPGVIPPVVPPPPGTTGPLGPPEIPPQVPASPTTPLAGLRSGAPAAG